MRASSADRQRATDVLDTALREGRLDASEYDRRSRAVQAVKSVRELDRLLTDLPGKLGVREWTGHLRIRLADRDLATRWLADALAEERLNDTEHERRLTAALSARTYADLTDPLSGVPGPLGQPRESLLVSTADRQSVADQLSKSFADGLIDAKEHARLQASVQRARLYRDLDSIAVDRDDRASRTERAQAIRRLDRAHAAGRLSAKEHARRVAAADAATSDAQLAGLLHDLPVTPAKLTPDRSLLSPADEHRLSDEERDLAVQELQDAADDGRLTLDEYGERVHAVYAATTVGGLRPLLADLPSGRRATVPKRKPRAPRKKEPAGQAADVPKSRTVRFFSSPLFPVLVTVAAVVFGFVMYNHHDTSAPRQGLPPKLRALWTAPFDRPSNVTGAGSWIVGDTVVRAGTDKITAYAVADGHAVWTFQLPAGQAVCSMSRTTAQNLGVVGYGPVGKTGFRTFIALNLRTGQEVWHFERPASTAGAEDGSDEVAIAGELAVFRESRRFVAVGLARSEPRWQVPVAAGCRTYAVASGTDVAVLLSACANHVIRLAVVDAVTGGERWHTELHSSVKDETAHRTTGEKTTVVISAEPMVVWTSDEGGGGGGGGAFISFDARGGRLATVPDSQPDLDIWHSAAAILWARPVRHAVVIGDELVIEVRRAGDNLSDSVAAYSLADGRRRWVTDLSMNYLSAIATVDGQVLAVYASPFGSELQLLSAQDGRVRQREEMNDPMNLFDLVAAPDVQVVDGRVVLVSENGTEEPPVVVLGTR